MQKSYDNGDIYKGEYKGWYSYAVRNVLAGEQAA